MDQSLRILVAEDQPDSVELLKQAFSRTGVAAPVSYVTDGEETIRYLKREEPFANRAQHPLPTMLLLDLNMPRLDGFGVLEWLQVQPELRRLLVIVFTSSDDQSDINCAFELGADSYLVKPADFTGLKETVRSLQDYWLRFNQCSDCLEKLAWAI
jgi:CheY-like chemotaxis protein